MRRMCIKYAKIYQIRGEHPFDHRADYNAIQPANYLYLTMARRNMNLSISPMYQEGADIVSIWVAEDVSDEKREFFIFTTSVEYAKQHEDTNQQLILGDEKQIFTLLRDKIASFSGEITEYEYPVLKIIKRYVIERNIGVDLSVLDGVKPKTTRPREDRLEWRTEIGGRISDSTASMKRLLAELYVEMMDREMDAEESAWFAETSVFASKEIAALLEKKNKNVEQEQTLETVD